MWNRAGLKSNAKENLKRYYWTAFGVCIVSALFNGGTTGFSGAGRSDSITEAVRGGGYDINPAVFFTIFISVLTVMLAFSAVVVLLKIFVGNILIVGKNRFFMEARDYDAAFGSIGYGFVNGRFGNVALTMFLMDLFIFLWSLLLVIPGIIKSYEYAMVPYILSENPELDRRRVFEISKEMMRGEKFNYFVLQLSFIGWILLGSLACCVGVFFVNPYIEATCAEFYGWAREKVLASGAAGNMELKGFGSVQY